MAAPDPWTKKWTASSWTREWRAPKDGLSDLADDAAKEAVAVRMGGHLKKVQWKSSVEEGGTTRCNLTIPMPDGALPPLVMPTDREEDATGAPFMDSPETDD